MLKITESESNYSDIDKMSTIELLNNINQEDAKVHLAIQKIIPEIEKFVDEAFLRLKNGGRLFYIGAGTSGRLGIVDASECPPTFGVPHDLVIGIIAGGDKAIRKAVEFAEDDKNQAWKDLSEYFIDAKDVLIGIAASGTTPYVLGGIQKANEIGVLTAGISCNPQSPLSEISNHALSPIVGPEFITGSTRMKSGTAQKLILNMISTSLMVKLGRVQGNKMVDMQLSNEKLVDRGTKMVQEKLNIPYNEAQDILLKFGSVREAVLNYSK
jgi:N-acetylmuramic acid 6-phosphate etherase